MDQFIQLLQLQPFAGHTEDLHSTADVHSHQTGGHFVRHRHGGTHGTALSGVDIRHDANFAPLGDRTAAEGAQQALRAGIEAVRINDRRVVLICNSNQMFAFLFHSRISSSEDLSVIVKV